MGALRGIVDVISQYDPLLRYLNAGALQNTPGLFRVWVLRKGEALSLTLEPHEMISISRGSVLILSEGEEVASLSRINGGQRAYLHSRSVKYTTVIAENDAVLCCIDLHVYDHVMSFERVLNSNVLISGDLELVKILRKNFHLKGFSLNAIMNILSTRNELYKESNSVVIPLNSELDNFYVLIQGECFLSRFNFLEEGFDTPTTLPPGDGFGLEEIFMNQRSDYMVTAVSACIFLRIGKEVVLNKVNQEKKFDVSPNIAKSMLDDGYTLLDVRSIEEHEDIKIPKSKIIPLESLDEQIPDLNPSSKFLVYCRSGRRSLAACYVLHKNGFSAYNLAGGIIAWPYEKE